ncbi:glycosyltransferase family 2 protein [Candidatus Woesebacteria bacterium]|nr:glycosyltransferase family 2 protein [Candidatus Woesebacteria bacterium]
MNLTAVVLAKNEEKNIVACLQSLSFCDRVVVLDDNSTDNTAALARKESAEVINAPVNDNFATQRNKAMNMVKTDWLLFVDADERVTPELRDEIQSVLQHPTCDVYAIKRIDVFWGKKLALGELYKAAHQGFARLMKKDTGHWEGTIHECFATNRNTCTLEHPLIHHAHDSIKGFLLSVNTYSTIRAKELMKQGIQPSLFHLIFFPLGKFFYTYFFLLGCVEGVQGFIYSFIMSFHSFLVRAKLYQYTMIDDTSSR